MKATKTIQSEEQFASIICGCGQCLCAYDCGHRNKPDFVRELNLMGKETTCPLAKYHVKPDPRTFWERLESGDTTEVTVADCWNFCANHCEHAVTEANGTTRLADYETVCIDCPVNMARESISLSESESRCC